MLPAVEFQPMQKLDAAKIAERRKELGLSQTKAAAAGKMTLTQWNDVETGGRVNVTIETLAKIAAALECDARNLITPAEKPKRKGK